MAMTKEFIEEMAQAQDAFVWEAPSWEGRERGRRWYILMGLVVFVMTAYAVWTMNYLFAFIILLSAVILVLAGNMPPKPVLIQIGHNGLVYNGKFYQFGQVADFAIVYHPPQTKVLYIQPRNMAWPRLRIELEDQDPIAIREHLKQYVDEDLDLRDEHYSDIFARLLKI